MLIILSKSDSSRKLYKDIRCKAIRHVYLTFKAPAVIIHFLFLSPKELHGKQREKTCMVALSQAPL
jgi:hypothetical protein